MPVLEITHRQRRAFKRWWKALSPSEQIRLHRCFLEYDAQEQGIAIEELEKKPRRRITEAAVRVKGAK